jgi:hypothetical protein
MEARTLKNFQQVKGTVPVIHCPPQMAQSTQCDHIQGCMKNKYEKPNTAHST